MMSSPARPPWRRKVPLLLGLMLAFIVLLAAGAQVAFAAVVDSGFESGTDGAALASPPWTLSGAPQNAEYDSAQAKVGLLSGWIKGPAAAAYGGVAEAASSGMTADGSEIRFWLYQDTTNQLRRVYDATATNAGRAYFLYFPTTGAIQVVTNRTATGYTTGGYTTVGTQATGWTEYRIVMNFTNDTYQLSRRTVADGAWTQLKAAGAPDFNIPMTSATDVTQSNGTVFAAYQNANLWIDAVQYSTTPIVDPDVTPPAVPLGLSAAGGATSVSLTWTANTEPDLAGYNLYRGGVKVNTALITATTYVDGGLAAGSYGYQLTAVDTTGNESALSLPVSATVGVQDMPITSTSCDACHAAHGFPPPCSACHGDINAYHPGGFGDPSAFHTPADVTGCDNPGCHYASLTIEHYQRTPSGGGTFTCATCHGSANPLVKAAIAANNSACSACHPGAGGHTGAHESATADNALGTTGFVCGDCHDGNLQVEHSKMSSSSAAAGCDACHPSPRDTLTPWDKETCVQAGCHGSVSTSAMHGNEAASHAIPSTYENCMAAGCHATLVGTSIAELHASAAIPGAVQPSVVDNCFESGVDGAALASPPWTLSGAPQNAEYDSARAKVGLLSGWIKGPAAAAYGGVAEAASSGMTADGSEIRFWLYQDTTNQFRRVYDATATNAGRAYFLYFPTTGAIQVVTSRTATGYTTGGYTTVGTQATGWTEYRIVMNFTNDTYQLSRRTVADGAWTQLKAAGAPDFNIPMTSATDVTQSNGTVFAAYQNANLWIDCVKYQNGGIDDTVSQPRASCQICHYEGVTPTKACLTCHPDRANPHGYDTADHTAAASCVQTCHTDITGMTDLKPLHDAATGTDFACGMCHNATYVGAPGFSPWNGSCDACHPAGTLHTGAPAAHAVDGACFTSTCHGTDVSAMHAMDFRGSGEIPPGCPACHDTGKTPSKDCVPCHLDLVSRHSSTTAHAALKTELAANSAGCVACHGSDVMAVLPADNPITHRSEHVGCSCHAYGEAAGATACEDCHVKPMDPTAPYPYHVGAHDAVEAGIAGETSTACVSCHGTNLLDVSAGNAHIAGEHAGCSCHAQDPASPNYVPLPEAAECADCHKGSFAPHGFTNGDQQHHEEAWPAASGHNTTTFGTIGAKTKFDGSQGVTLYWEAEKTFDPMPATWEVEAGFQWATAPEGYAGTKVETGTIGVVSTAWEFPTVNVFWQEGDPAAPADAMYLDATSVVTCEDCHSGLVLAGPHGADDNFGLDPDYPADYSYGELTKNIESYPSGIRLRSSLKNETQTYTSGMSLICSKCHDLQNYQSGTTKNNPLPRISTGDAPFEYKGVTWDPVYIDAASSRNRGYYVWTRNDGSQVDPAAITINEGAPGVSDTTWTSSDPEAQAWIQGNAGTVTAATIGSSNTAHSSHHQDTNDGSAQCVGCHIAIPHGWKRPRLLVNSGWNGTANSIGAGLIAGDRAPYRDPDLLGTSRTNGGILMDPVTGYNGMGMLTLSAVDNHYLWAGSGSATDPAKQYNTGAAYWSEPSCQACNDHAGEDGVRIIDE